MVVVRGGVDAHTRPNTHAPGVRTMFRLTSERRVKIKAENKTRPSWEDKKEGIQTWKYHNTVLNWENVPGMFSSFSLFVNSCPSLASSG